MKSIPNLTTAADYYRQLRQRSPLPSYDPTLDTLLDGGFVAGLVYFLSGPKALLPLILMKVAVNAFQAEIDGGFNAQKVVFIDGTNRFNPYLISKLALTKNLSPTYVLNRIMVARAFTWCQMVEILEEKVSAMDPPDVVLVSGMTAMFEGTSGNHLNAKSFQDLNRIIAGLKTLLRDHQPIIIMTGALHPQSQYRPLGGRLLSHFCNVVVNIKDSMRFLDYSLQQHPFLPFRQQRFWKPMQLRGDIRPQKVGAIQAMKARNLTLDFFLNKK